MEGFKPEAMSDRVLEGFEAFVFELEDRATVETDQVIVVASIGRGFVPGFAIRKFPLGGQAQASQKLQGPVDGGIANSGIDFYDPSIDLGEVLVARRIEKDAEDLLSLLRCFQSSS